MSSTESVGRHDDVLNDSWEKLSYKSQSSISPSPPQAASHSSSVVERLLRDAQRESSRSASSNVGSMCSCSASPRSMHSLSTDMPPDTFEVSMIQGIDETPPPCEPSNEWVWDWSSRPEIVPPWACAVDLQPFKHPVSRRRTYSIRNSRLMQSLMVSLENLPLLIFTHACTFLLGAATMLVILKKYYRYAAVASAALD